MFSLLLAVILVGIGAGSVLGGVVQRRTGKPAEWFMLAQGLFVAATLGGSRWPTSLSIDQAADGRSAAPRQRSGSLGQHRADPAEVGVPALLMGLSFPLANGHHPARRELGRRRAGVLYFATRLAPYRQPGRRLLLLPSLGLQASATVLWGSQCWPIVPLYFARAAPAGTTRARVPCGASRGRCCRPPSALGEMAAVAGPIT